MEANNVKAMREALEAAQTLLGNIGFESDSYLDNMAAPVVAQIGRALSAPPRNCDRFKTLEEAEQAYNDAMPHEANDE